MGYEIRLARETSIRQIFFTYKIGVCDTHTVKYPGSNLVRWKGSSSERKRIKKITTSLSLYVTYAVSGI